MRSDRSSNVNGQENLSHEPGLPADTAIEDTARLLDAARAGLAAGPDSDGWAEQLDVDPTAGEQAVREAAAKVLQARVDAWLQRPGAADEIWKKATSPHFAPGIERCCDARAFLNNTHLYINDVIDSYRSAKGYWATEREHLFPVRPGPFGFNKWISSNIGGVAKKTRRGQEIGGGYVDDPPDAVETAASGKRGGSKIKVIPVAPETLRNIRDNTEISPRDDSFELAVAELVAAALKAAISDEQVLSYGLLRLTPRLRVVPERQVRGAAIAAVSTLSKAVTLLPSSSPDQARRFMTSPERSSGAAIRVTDDRERTRDGLDQHVKRTKPHVIFAVAAALCAASEQAVSSFDEDAGRAWDLTIWSWRAAQLPQLSSMLYTAARTNAGPQISTALDFWSNELVETCWHPMRHGLVHGCLTAATTEGLEKARKALLPQPPEPPGPARAALEAHTERLEDLQNRLSSLAKQAKGTPAATDR